jgi:hypothetical protein
VDTCVHTNIQTQDREWSGKREEKKESRLMTRRSERTHRPGHECKRAERPAADFRDREQEETLERRFACGLCLCT